MKTLCFTCKTEPAGNPYGGPYSAYCEGCQPRDTRQQPNASQRACGACGAIFATLTDFDGHQVHYPRGHLLEGVFTGTCMHPLASGLEQVRGVWGTPDGNAHRASLAERLPGRSAASPGTQEPGQG
jgi:hypothetical protein